MTSLLKGKEVFELTQEEAEWLKGGYPANYAILQEKIRSGDARIVESGGSG